MFNRVARRVSVAGVESAGTGCTSLEEATREVFALLRTRASCNGFRHIETECRDDGMLKISPVFVFFVFSQFQTILNIR